MIKLNPLTLVILNILFPVVIFLGKGVIYETICLLIAVAVLIIYKRYLQILKFVIGYLIFLSLAYLLSISNVILIADLFGTLVYIILRMIPVMMIAYILVKDIKSNELLSAFEQIHLPKKIMLSITVALRFFPTYKLEIKMIRESLKMRNINLSIKQPLKFLEYWLVPVLMRINLIAEEMTATAMTKGVESPMRRTSFYNVKMRAVDWIFLTVILIIFILLLMGRVK
ncbi:energy-coupling factor transporter transmembrane component T [Gemella sp. 27098_8_92]|uniref:energy-coupling factor transporter transmembrane component T n=1 Tax=Gemella sp. 27098_8_92 TaxID=3003687 RepID=UPI00352DBE15